MSEKQIESRQNTNGKDKVELKPFVKWAGGKGQLLPHLKKYINTDGKSVTKYAEPMVGGGALFFSLLNDGAFKKFYISDINAELINAYKVIQSEVEQLINILKTLQELYCIADSSKRKDIYYSVRDKFNNTALNEITAVTKAAYFIFLNRTCFNGLYRVNSKGKFNVPVGDYKNPKICDEENLRNISVALEKTVIVCGDYSLCNDFIDDNTFAYFDPPYRPISKTSSFNSYDKEVFNDEEQYRLAEFVKKANKKGVKILISNSDPHNTDATDDFFEDLYREFVITNVDARRMINSKTKNRGMIKELLINN